MLPVQPGDIICVRSKSRWGKWIRLGAWLRGRPATVDHVAVAHHRDDAGVMWAVEGRPGGVGWVDIRKYDNPWMITNAAQPKTDEQRRLICALADDLLKRPYDYGAIMIAAAEALHLPDLWASDDFDAEVPAHVICSSLAAWVYRRVGLAIPDGDIRSITPGDWARLIAERGWS